MKEEIGQLTSLQAKVDSTWQLLDIDKMKTEMKVLEVEMQESNFWSDQENATKTAKRHEELKEEVEIWEKMKAEVGELLGLAHDLEKNSDEEMEEDLKFKIKDLEDNFEKLEFYLLLSHKNDKKNAIVSIHSGSGGTEAQDWAEMLRRMYFRYSESKGWKVTILDETRGQEAGIKSSTFRVEGRWAYGHLKGEHGTHRLVRISPFDAEKMRHTSFALLEVIPEMEESDDLQIDEKDLRIDTFCSSGAGGQSVNTAYSAVRVVHIPTSTTVSCQNERSQLQNKETALKILKSKLQKLKEEEEEEERLKLRGEYKSPEWGNQIRSYVLHPYHMVKDLRSRYETTDDQKVLDGGLDEFAEAYLKWLKSKK